MKNTMLCLVLGGLLSIISQQAASAEALLISFKYAKGQMLFEKNCSSCHGVDLTGSKEGPPLLHPFYKPSHHGDASFYRAGLKGVKAHHWNFGDMPPIADMTESKMKHIITFVRYYQQQKKLY
jgi:mono/diheme cytochrome c family protein